MKKNNLAFEKPEKLIKHINQNWNDLNDWWHSKKSSRFKKIYLNNYFFKQKNPIEKWDRFLRKVKK